ncbi:MAG: TetR/AcrR family transcriptional regulator [Bacteroidota bacterium]
MARLSKDDWLAEGFKVLSEFAQNKLRILYLCERLKVTRGSFYHHFSSIDDYIEQLMLSWEQSNTRQIIKIANQGGDPKASFERLNALVVNIDQSIETAIRSWSHYHPIVQTYLHKVDQLRLHYLEELFLKNDFSPSEAADLATLEYAVLIGVQQLYPHIKANKMDSLYETYRKYFLAAVKP